MLPIRQLTFSMISKKISFFLCMILGMRRRRDQMEVGEGKGGGGKREKLTQGLAMRYEKRQPQGYAL